MTYKAVGFDYGGVIRGQPNAVYTEKICEILGVSKKEYNEVYLRHNRKVYLGLITWVQLWQEILDELKQPDKLPEVLNLSNPSDFAEINQGVLDVVDIVKAHGLKTGLLSNNTKEAALQMRQQGLEEHFDVFQISVETGLVKPEPKAFENFVQRLGVSISELVFIDDNESSLSTAAQLGYTPILFTDYGSLVQKLINLGILD